MDCHEGKKDFKSIIHITFTLPVKCDDELNM